MQIGSRRLRMTREGGRPVLRQLVEPLHAALLPYYQGEERVEYPGELMALLAEIMTVQYRHVLGVVGWKSVKSTLEHPGSRGP